MTDIKERLKTALAEFVSYGGANPHSIPRALYHGESDAISGIIADAMDEAQRSGKVLKCPNNGGHAHVHLRLWDRFVEHGLSSLKKYEITALSWGISRHLAEAYNAWRCDPTGAARAAYPEDDAGVAAILHGVAAVERFGPEHVETVANLLAQELEHPVSLASQRLSGNHESRMDGRSIDVRWDGWAPILYEYKKNFDGIRPAELPVMAPPARHLVMETSGKMVIFGRKDFSGILTEAVRKLERDLDEVEYVSIGNHAGANFCALRFFASSGMLDIHLGDHFPSLVRDGDVVRGNWVGESPLADSCEMIRNESVHMPILGSLEDALDLVEAMGFNRDAALLEIEDYIIDVPPGPLHVYVPDGLRAQSFAEKAKPQGLSDMGEAEDYFLISPSPIVFDGGCLDVEMPERKPLPAGPALDL